MDAELNLREELAFKCLLSLLANPAIVPQLAGSVDAIDVEGCIAAAFDAADRFYDRAERARG